MSAPTTITSSDDFSWPASTSALTSIFTPAPSCLTQISCIPFHSETATSTTCLAVLAPATSGCDILRQTDVAFSPGVCPTGYTIALVKPGNARVPMTSAVCCPSSFNFGTLAAEIQTGIDNKLGCVSNFPTYGWTSIFALSGSSTTVSAARSTLFADAVSIGWDCDNTEVLGLLPTAVVDCPDFTPGTSATGGSVTISSPEASFGVTPSPGTDMDNTPGTDTDNTPGTGGLSAGAGVGIGVGAFVALLIVGGAAFLFMRRRKNKKPKEPTHEIMTTEEKRYPEPGHELAGSTTQHEMGETRAYRPELEAPNGAHELQGSGLKNHIPGS
ncbi:hypothetical protein EJ05DRAFT_192785 [Pseudovirgaria hyperparasitica]|uniref:LPXTG-domain-containing protein n=1 Tax=Pseudovirgaria hyperparasitica TaxID=470096 RepID=A0A6A6WIU5_9PEZI|nr:uncharacterized protein EJ05DRAFT_192785 [Pseudovirgaria hyperparasitica]KAF2762000.1 hypothetical protein EJ05DRAFT_192785 [Pseudovirgaria hyperparasitica]